MIVGVRFDVLLVHFTEVIGARSKVCVKMMCLCKMIDLLQIKNFGGCELYVHTLVV